MSTEKKLNDLIDKAGRSCVLDLTFERFGSTILTYCKLSTPDNINVLCIGGRNTDELIKRTSELFDKVTSLHNTSGRYWGYPSHSDQPNNKGYCRRTLHTTAGVQTMLEYKREDDKFYVTRILHIDKDGYTILDKPQPISDDMEFIKDLSATEKLYQWNNMVPLAGSAGEAIVKNGEVIKTKTIAIA